ncbi:Uncharacterised protein [Yersinia enterocolitica]|nr:Uncharacterised protein [Yersinia enterocolitica]
MACLASVRKVSRSATTPINFSFSSTATAVLPLLSSSSNCASHSAVNNSGDILLGALTRTTNPLTLPSTPMPASARRSSASGSIGVFCCARCMIATARGWCEPASTAAASDNRRVSLTPEMGRISVTCGLPSVSVPVLSNATV